MRLGYPARTDMDGVAGHPVAHVGIWKLQRVGSQVQTADELGALTEPKEQDFSR